VVYPIIVSYTERKNMDPDSLKNLKEQYYLMRLLQKERQHASLPDKLPTISTKVIDTGKSSFSQWLTWTTAQKTIEKEI